MKAIIVAAGYGSRFLPASKTVPKEMFPVIDRPAIDFILQELRESGIEEILFITSRRKRALEDYVDREVELEQVFESEGAVAKQRTIAVPAGRFFFLAPATDARHGAGDPAGRAVHRRRSVRGRVPR